MEEAKAKLIEISELFQDYKNAGVNQKTKIENYYKLMDNCVEIEKVFIRCENVLLTEMRATIDELIRINGNKMGVIEKKFEVDPFEDSAHEQMIHASKKQSTQLDDKTHKFSGTKLQHWDTLNCLMKNIMAEIEKERITPSNML